MCIFKSKEFSKWARKQKLSNRELSNAAAEITAGLIDADLGGYVYKKRIARIGKGKLGGYRILVVMQKQKKLFFVYGFAKNETDNLAKLELIALKKQASLLVNFTDEEIEVLLTHKELFEI